MIRKNYDFRNLQNNEDYINMVNYSFNIVKCNENNCINEYNNLQKKLWNILAK